MHFLVIQHVAVEGLAALAKRFRAASADWTIVDFSRGDTVPADLTPYDAMIVMGGPMDVWQLDRFPWLRQEMDAIRHFVVELNRPFLGVCLGHQLLAETLGGGVRPGAVSEVGVHGVELTPAAQSDALLGGCREPLRVFQWHGAEVARLPEGATLLARSPDCEAQAFRYGRHAWGFQFHVEVEAENIKDWAELPEYAGSLLSARGEEGLAAMLSEIAEAAPELAALVDEIGNRFCIAVEAAKSRAA
ncbi:type 1 glutamine amidotransferase [Methylocystis bryophila]|uniref:Glutamine amidotransferase domain-containing protein n=1 Tax=Methylocystis bryophila TaxID=655015 RepID=A0A1W6MWU1_9HYPH|nr:type 1 glutamine amidotransferase [Methylocystis bryophila]ARN82035.1 hypothetical protein B1812_14190 [Methylocystis bryophila]BDV38157.1 GMP synthase [Methylocystis bryophila]